MPSKGLAHDHVRLLGTGLLARVPKQSQLGLAPAANLAYQSACFDRAEPSGHTPKRWGRLQPTAAGTPLQWGALLVQEIEGQPPQLPRDLPLLVDALAAIHRLPLPLAEQRPPLLDDTDALALLAREIDAQAQHLPAAGLHPAAAAAIATTRARWQRVLTQPVRPPKRMITFDAHPGNFIVKPAAGAQPRRAFMVDLEKLRYSHPPLDLAHATLLTSTTWDADSSAKLSLDCVVQACERWLAQMHVHTEGCGHSEPGRVRRIGRRSGLPIDPGPEPQGDPWRPWLVPLREAMWLWAVTWCAKWRVLSAAAPAAVPSGEDWSAQHNPAALVAHVRSRVDYYLSPQGVQFVVQECQALRQHFGAVGDTHRG
jgi:hypothetical protein